MFAETMVTVYAFSAISLAISDDVSKVSNLQRVITYCKQHFPSAVCHLSLTDLLYCTEELRQNVVAFVVDLFDSLEAVGASAAAGGSGSGTDGSMLSGESCLSHCM